MFNKKIKFLFFQIRRQFLVATHTNLFIGLNSKIDLKTTIRIDSNYLAIGENVYLRSESKGYHAGMPFPTSILIDKDGGEVVIGDNCRINGCYIHAKGSIEIGRNSVIASGTNIIDSNGHLTFSENRTVGRDLPEPIIIGENVWIGLNSTILKGTVIGDNSIVTAGTVVKGTYPNNSIIQGNPGKVVKKILNSK
ncbi:acyltransferase [uncultured Christiangramia sp.]|uniref:acyltransferase n=1 Tax=Christiangramia sp. 3-2217-3z TaxID=3417564 RepID=UPI002625C4E9|nr:acyltransferase [uncultured Christiangramia sp.]